jgi:hypothetical protein
MQTTILFVKIEVEELSGIENIDPHYKIIGYVSIDDMEIDAFSGITTYKQIERNDLRL